MAELQTIFDLRDDDVRELVRNEKIYLNSIFMRRGVRREEEYCSAQDIIPTLDQIFGEGGNDDFLLKVMLSKLRLCEPTLAFSPYVVLAGSVLSDRPGTAVLWAHAIYDQARNREFTFAELLMHLSTVGAPSEHGLAKLWEAQKDRTAPLGNRLDDPEAWSAETPTT